MYKDRQVDTRSGRIVILISNLVAIVKVKSLQRMLSRSVWMSYVRLKIDLQELLSYQRILHYQKVTKPTSFVYHTLYFEN